VAGHGRMIGNPGGRPHLYHTQYITYVARVKGPLLADLLLPGSDRCAPAVTTTPVSYCRH